MKIYRLKGKINKDKSYLKYSGMNFDDQEKLISGDLISLNKFAEYEVIGKSKKKPDVYTIGSTEFYINEKVKNIILNTCTSDDNLQFINVEIEKENYYLLSILNNIECFNWKESEYTTYSSKNVLNEVTKLVIDINKLNHRKIFRLKDYKFEIFIAETLKDELEKSGIDGISFLESMDLTIG